MGLLDRFTGLFKVEPMPDIWFNEKKRTLLWVARRMRWYRNIGGNKTPEQEVIAKLKGMKQFDKNWTQKDEEALYGSEHENAMFRITLRMREREAAKKLEEARQTVTEGGEDGTGSMGSHQVG